MYRLSPPTSITKLDPKGCRNNSYIWRRRWVKPHGAAYLRRKPHRSAGFRAGKRSKRMGDGLAARHDDLQDHRHRKGSAPWGPRDEARTSAVSAAPAQADQLPGMPLPTTCPAPLAAQGGRGPVRASGRPIGRRACRPTPGRPPPPPARPSSRACSRTGIRHPIPCGDGYAFGSPSPPGSRTAGRAVIDRITAVAPGARDELGAAHRAGPGDLSQPPRGHGLDDPQGGDEGAPSTSCRRSTHRAAVNGVRTGSDPQRLPAPPTPANPGHTLTVRPGPGAPGPPHRP
jgi:hypothetical protein